MDTEKIALGMIVKATDDEAPLLDACLTSIEKYVDAIYLTLNVREGVIPSEKVEQVAKDHKAIISYALWNDNFAEMRNFNLSQIDSTYDWVLWLDTDDTVKNPQKIKDVIKNASNIDGLMVTYEYDKDEFGNTTTEHINCRMFRNNGSFAWPKESNLHETPTETRRAAKAYTADFRVSHNSTGDRIVASNIRNIGIMEKMLERDGNSPDPRTLFYLGTAYIDAGRNNEAIALLETYLTLSGWDEERAQAHVWLGRLYRDQRDDVATAVSHFLQALYQNPKEITAFVEMGATEMMLDHWSKAIVWLEQAVVLKPSPTALVLNPLERTYRSFMMLAQCHLEMGGKNLSTALTYSKLAYGIRPDTDTENFMNMLKSIMKEKNTVDSFVNAVKNLPSDKAERAYAKLDVEYQKNPAVLAVMKLHREPKIWGKKSIVIHCGSGVLKDWGPWSLESGIGGSEEAVIRLSKHLAGLGWSVTIYANPGIRDGIYDGVTWKNYWEIDLRDTYDIFVAWRSPEFFDRKLNARKTYVWMHDVMDDAEFTPARLENITKVMLLSKYHRSVYPSIPENKVMYSANGIDPEEFEAWDGKIERDPKQVIYMSSHVRGLDTLCDVWEDVLKEVPDAKLTVAYGWQSYDSINRNNPERMAWKDALIKRMDTLGITDLGRIGQEEIVKMIQGAGIWAYPTQFCEIYCITAVKAQAGGAWPVCTDFAALAEVVKCGDVQHMEPINAETPIGEWSEGGIEKYTKDLIVRLKNPPQETVRQKMMTQTRESNSWLSVAKGWTDEFTS